nr:Ig-like domain-containing protein [Cohnella faecalis]
MTLKHDDFSAAQDVDGIIPGKSPEKWLQRNGNAALATDDQGRKVLRVTPNQTNAIGSAFHGNMISFGKDRSFSTYFTFRMSGIANNAFAAGDGLVFSIQTLSKEAGVKGGGMGYGSMKRSFGIEFDTFANSATVASDPLDPKAIGVNIGGTPNSSRGGTAVTYDTSHIAVVADGNVDHSKSTTSPKGKVFPASVGGSTSNPSIIATPTAGETVPIYNFKTADTGTWATNDAYPFYNGEIYHAWIVYNGPTDTIEVYMGKNGTFDTSKLKIKKSGLGLREYLEQDEAYVGFSAATGSAYENHDILKWYLNNNELPIEPENPDYNYEAAPPLISITSTDYAVYGSTTSTTSRIITAQLKNYDGSDWTGGPYPVTFSLFKEEAAKSYTVTKTDGSTQVVSLKPRVDDTRVALKGETRRTNSDGSSMRYASVMSDANGVATIQISNTLPTAINDSNVKAIVGDHFGTGVYGGGAYDEKPVTFAADAVPPTITSAAVDVSNPNHVKAFLSEYVLYPTDRNHPENWTEDNSATWNANGFKVLIPDPSSPGTYISVPATIVGGSGSPDEPLVLELAGGKVVPFGYDVKLQYVKADGSLQDAAANLVQDQTLFVDDYPFTPKGAAVVNDQDRKTVEVNFDFPVRDNAVIPGSFKVYYDTGSGKTLAAVTGAVSDGTDPNKLVLTLGTAVPAGATVTLDYVVPGSGGKVTNVTIDGLSAGHHTLKALTDFNVANQMAPNQASVIPDANRNKVKVVFDSEVELQGVAATLAAAFKIGISSQGDLIDVSNVVIDSSDASGKTLILTLGGANLPSGGVPYGDVVKLNYDSTIASVDVKEKNGSERSLEWLTNFPVANQQILNVVIVSPADGSTTNNPNTVITGTSEPGSTVTVVVKDSNDAPVDGEVEVDSSGNWTFTPDDPLTDGTYTVSAEATDAAGNKGTDTSAFTVDTEAPDVDITGPTNGSITKDPNTVITGTNEPGTTLTVVVKDSNGDPVDGEVEEDGSGNWTFTPDEPLPDGTYTVTVEATDGNGNEGTDTSTFTVDTVKPIIVIVSPADGSTTNNPNTVITGTSEPGSTVTVVVKDSNDAPVDGEVEVDSSGNWTFTPDDPLTDGTYTVSAEATDAAGNKGTDTSAFTVDTEAPDVDITGPTNGSITKDPNTVITGTNEPGTTLTVVVKDNNGDPVDGEVEEDGSGNWTFTPDEPLPDGQYTVTVKAEDSNGNEGTDTSTFTVDTTKPSIAVVSPADSSITNNPNTVITGTSEPGSTVTVVVKDSNDAPVDGEVEVDSSGNWTFTPDDPLTDGTYTVSAEATDAAGNKGTDTSAFTVDTEAPDVDITGPTNGSITKDPNTVITGTNEPGTTLTVVVKDNNGDPVDGEVEEDGSGNWTFTPDEPLPDGQYTVTVKAEDSNGNEGTDTSTFTVDTTKPSIAVVSPADGSTTNNPNTVITGTSEPGSTVTVVVKDSNDAPVDGEVEVDSSGNWTFTPDDPLTDGTYTVSAEATDAAGNKGTDTSAFTVDTEAPDVDITGPTNGSITKDPNTVITGTNEPGTTLTVVVKDNNGDPVDGEVEEDGSGNWTFTPDEPLPDGQYTVTVKAEDSNGNEGTDTSTFTVDTTKPSIAVVSPADGSTTNNPNTVITGTSEPGSTVTVVVKDSNDAPVDGEVEVDSSGNWTFTPDDPLTDGTYTVSAEATDAAGNKGTDTSEFTVSLTYFIDLKANPDVLVADGNSISVLTAKVTDSQGNPVSGVDVDFSAFLKNTSTPKGTFVDAAGQVIGTPRATTVNGVATIRFKSEAIQSVTSVKVDIKAAVHDTVHGIHAEDKILVTFEPAVVSGIITGGANHQPLAGVTVTLLDANGQPIPGRTAVTDEDGHYVLPITEGNQIYKIQVSQTVGTGSSAVVVTYVQEVAVDDGISGLGQEFVSDQTIAGIIGGKRPDGTIQPLDFGSFVGNDSAGTNPAFGLFLKDGNQYVTSSNGTVTVPGESDGFSINGQGVFVAGGLTAGTTYQLEVRYYYDVANGNGGVSREFIVIAKKTVTVSANGEMNINEELIDPFGVITDSVTHAIIPNAHVVLKYADTTRNRNKGIVPGTTVVLPTLAGFLPANNANPQNSDTGGNYAFMVFGNTDYVIEATATGYQKYRSPVISVEQDIVRWDFEMNPIVPTSGGGVTVTPPAEKVTADVTTNIVVERSTYEEGSEAPVVILYKNEADKPLAAGQLKVTLPDNVIVIDADGGKVTGNVIVWEVKDLAAGQVASHRIRVKFPNIDSVEKVVTLKAEFVVDGELAHPENAKSSVKVLLFSNRFGNERHTRFVMGYPDLMFKPERSLTRAELATIIAHLLGEYDSGTTKNYSDVPKKFWAYKYIQTVSRHGIFSGYPMEPSTLTTRYREKNWRSLWRNTCSWMWQNRFNRALEMRRAAGRLRTSKRLTGTV